MNSTTGVCACSRRVTRQIILCCSLLRAPRAALLMMQYICVYVPWYNHKIIFLMKLFLACYDYLPIFMRVYTACWYCFCLCWTFLIQFYIFSCARIYFLFFCVQNNMRNENCHSLFGQGCQLHGKKVDKERNIVLNAIEEYYDEIRELFNGIGRYF